MATVHWDGGYGKAWQHTLAYIRMVLPYFLGHDLALREQGLAAGIRTKMEMKNIVLSESQVRRWTPKVAKLLGITKHRLYLWGLSVKEIGIQFGYERHWEGCGHYMKVCYVKRLDT
jgi:hypothetical protein